jgi:hypothetical protein
MGTAKFLEAVFCFFLNNPLLDGLQFIVILLRAFQLDAKEVHIQ